MSHHSFSRANVITLIPLVNTGNCVRVLETWARGSGVYFGDTAGKKKWSAPLYRHCMRTVATLQRLDYPTKGMFILVLSATVIIRCGQQRRIGGADSSLVLNCQSQSNFPDHLLKVSTTLCSTEQHTGRLDVWD